MKTLNSFCATSHIDAKLIKAVVKQSGGWNHFREHAEDICNHGASGGFSGFYYYAETVSFYQKNKAQILGYAKSIAEELGESVLDMIKNFRCLSDSTLDEIGKTVYGTGIAAYDTTVANCLAWFALEEVARSYCDLLESEKL